MKMKNIAPGIVLIRPGLTDLPMNPGWCDAKVLPVLTQLLIMLMEPLEPSEYAELSGILVDLADDLRFVADSLDGIRSLP